MQQDRQKLYEQILRYESGQLRQHEAQEFFQGLVDTGLAWQLQGSYGRTAHDMLRAGFIHQRGE